SSGESGMSLQSTKPRRPRRRGTTVACALAVALCLPLPAPPAAAGGGGLPGQVWPAGTVLASFDRGGRINTFHGGCLYLAAGRGNGPHVGAFLYDIGDPTAPRLVHSLDAAASGHIWLKIGHLFGRSYSNPDVAHLGNGSNHLSDFADPF